MNKIIEEFKDRLISKELASKNDFEGCTEQEINILEENFNIVLPDLYKDFLRLAGHRVGKFLEGTDLLYRHLFSLRKSFESSISYESEPFELTESMFIFLSHQGYIYQFFDTSEKLSDPPVYTYEEGENPLVKKSFDKFSLWLFDKPIETYSTEDYRIEN